MLKALELHGFKSFADKTRFDFPAGITVVVGPNGSGKSNIVDAIKWVLGEQSAKSLRGKDMSDVIFKGSGTSGRKAMNTAEATIVLENADRRLPLDAPEVHITRRVYRSGEGEYLINRQPARLKDIRDMFRGTGVGVDAYSLIEQGKVDRLLQASAKDRRAIFEEAAGISRFKAKKVEAQRRLERVDQNLLRLADIVEEVENRLKAVRAQAGKARRYREYSDRLQQLRTQIALVDWRRLSEQLAAIEAELTTVAEQVEAASAEEQRLEARRLELETTAEIAAEELRNCDNQLASARQHTAQQQSITGHERSRVVELEDEARLHLRNLLLMTDKAGDLSERLKATQTEVASAHAAQQAAVNHLVRHESHLADLARQHQDALQQVQSQRGEYVNQVQVIAALTSQLDAGQAQLTAEQESKRRMEQRLIELEASARELTGQHDLERQKEQSSLAELAVHQEQLEAAANELAESRNIHASRADDLAQLHGRRRGVAERAEVLEEFERTLEGLGGGVKEVLERAKGGHPTGPWSLVRGVVADFVHVSVEHAAAIDVALGEAAQAIVIEGGSEDARALVAAGSDLAGRVVVMSVQAIGESVGDGEGPSTKYSVLSTQPPVHHAAAPVDNWLEPSADLSSEMTADIQLMARADQLVECPPDYRNLVHQLLGNTLVVRTLDDALTLRQRAPQAARIVTLNGELVDEHGAIHFGPRQSAASLISRRSQLRAARIDLAVLSQQIADAQRETSYLKCEIDRQEERVRELNETDKSLERQVAAHTAAAQALAERAKVVQEQQTASAASLAETCSRGGAIESSLALISQQLEQSRLTADATRRSITNHEQQLARLESEHRQAADDVTAAKVELVRHQQRLEGLNLRLTQFEDDQRERRRAIDQQRQQVQQAEQRRESSELAMLAASAEIARIALQSQALTVQMRTAHANRDAAVAEKNTLSESLTKLRRQALKLRDQEHQLQLSAEQLRHQRQSLADRLREDYAIDLAAAGQDSSPEEIQERAAVEEEIDSLRRKINQIGAVNLSALEELDELEQRFATLSGQHKDLNEAKQSLERIIHKINADSRRLFLETLEAIRVNFQALYRRAFGGGKADIVLEEGVDVLECGVEIVATPPGKPSFNNSLLSGGEKALTAVALLLAIFQFRPSPFCVLDEVDAPFDEANIGRFIDVLTDFLGWTRFVLVTHSKKTMTAATTLYGVTMQESGVSKRVSVRFDDVTEDGHIRREAIARSAAEESAENAA